MIPAALHTSSSAFAALVWWVVPVVAVIGAVGYVIWVAKFQDKFENDTNRSVAKFSEFQRSFSQPSGVEVKEAQGQGEAGASNSNPSAFNPSNQNN